jgi:hypothetical protein
MSSGETYFLVTLAVLHVLAYVFVGVPIGASGV